MAEPVPRRADEVRTVSLEPIITLIAALFGGKLLGVLGAVLAIPVAATTKVTIEEWRGYRAGLAGRTQPEPRW
jgi:predicted PurR-regulated permease PerM